MDTRKVDPESIAAFARDGAAVLRGVFADWTDGLRQGVGQVMANPSPLERSYHAPGSSPFFQDLCNWRRIPAFEDFVLHSPAAQIAAGLMGSRVARFFHDHVLVKEPGTALATPWHQDLPYYCVTGPHNVSFWIPLDPVPRDICMECIAGSHAWQRIHKPKRFDGSDLYAGDDRVEMPDIDAHRAAYDILGWALEPGDAIAFHFATVHGAPATIRSLNRRRVFSARWVGEGAVFVDRRGKGSPPFPHLTLTEGAPFEGPDFPLVYGN
ncbi:MAG: phytanoyl-CoA dioxygenase [Gammaproteobacteria bacterium]|nr:phytanoyl-CoA dioxygenase [Gammaproteobacteria bacterium]